MQASILSKRFGVLVSLSLFVLFYLYLNVDASDQVVKYLKYNTYSLTQDVVRSIKSPPSYIYNKSRVNNTIGLKRLEELYKTAFNVTPGKVKKSERFGIKDIFADCNEVTNEHEFNFVIKPNIPECVGNAGGKKILVLAVVMISASFFEKRQVIRSTWANTQLLDDPLYDLRVIFAVGWWRNETSGVNEKIRKEAERFNDILQEDYLESYYNITIKVIGALKFVTEHCRNVDFVLRINDDMVPQPRNLVKFMNKLKSDNGNQVENLILGNILGNAPPIRGGGKWGVSKSEFEGEKYLYYMEGSAFIVSNDLAFNLYNLSRYVFWPPFSISLEDVYIGMLCHHFQAEFFGIGPQITHGLTYTKLATNEDILINRVLDSFYVEMMAQIMMFLDLIRSYSKLVI